MCRCESDFSHPHYDRYWTGSLQFRSCRPQYGIILNGGGDEQWGLDLFFSRADYGQIVILNASESNRVDSRMESTWLADGRLARRYRPKSMEHFGLRHRDAACDPYLIGSVAMASGIILGSGDQARYVERWKGTPLAEMLNRHVSEGKPLYGISAGAAVASEFVYSAAEGSIDSDEALRDPYHDPKYRDLEGPMHDFAPLRGCVVDTHFSARDRMGRLLSFVARFLERDQSRETPWPESLDAWYMCGLGIEEDTAVILEADGQMCVQGRAAYVVFPGKQARFECRSRRDLYLSGFILVKVTPGKAFNLIKRRGRHASRKEIEVDRGHFFVRRKGRFVPMRRVY